MHGSISCGRTWSTGARLLRRSPRFTAVTVLTLSLGIGATTGIFSTVQSLLVRPLPFGNPERLVLIWGSNSTEGQLRDVIAGPNFLDMQRENLTLEGMAAFAEGELTARSDEGAGIVSRLEVTPEFFSVLQVRPLLGRSFEADDGLAGRERVAMLSYGYWQTRFGGDPTVVGATLSAATGQPYTVIGVLPADFRFLSQSAVVTPLVVTALEQDDRTHYQYWVVGRLASGATPARAQDNLNGTMKRLGDRFPALAGWRVKVEPLGPTLVEPVRPSLLLLLAVVGVVLLLACANVANLLLARGIDRRRELAVRTALGAGRGRLLRQLLTEGTLLAAAAGLGGLFLGTLISDGLDVILPPQIAIAGSAAQVSLAPVRVDGWGILFTLGLSAATVVLFALLPAMKNSMVQPAEAMRAADRRTVGGRAPGHGRGVLIATEAALATSLLLVAGLMLRTVVALLGTDPGFRADGVVCMKVGSLHDRDEPGRARYYEQVERAAGTVPGVASAALNDYLVLANEDDYEGFHRPDRPKSRPGASPREEWRRVSPGYFATMGIRPVRGRLFREWENAEAPSVIVVNEAFARKHFAGEDPVGRSIVLHHKAYGVSEIVGVVSDERFTRLALPPKPLVYVPFQRAPRPVMALFVKTHGDPRAAIAAIQRAVWSVDRTQPIFEVGILNEMVAESAAVQRLTLWISAALAALAAILAGAGIYSVVSYATAQRTREIGLRMALGARQSNILRLVLGQGLRATLAGILIGLAGALAWTRAFSSLLYGVGPTDPATYVAVAAAVSLVAVAACWIPARRATGVSCSDALRSE